MSVLKFITLTTSGIQKLVSALQESTGNADAGKIIATTTTGKLHPSFLPVGVEIQTESIVASEALDAGDFVNIYDNASVRTARKADATAYAKRAMGFVLESVTSGGNATVYTKGVNDQLANLTPGGSVFLSDSTPGLATNTPASQTTGGIHQVLGVSLSATSALFEYDDVIVFE